LALRTRALASFTGHGVKGWFAVLFDVNPMVDYGFNDDARLFHRPNMPNISKQATAVFKLGHSDAAACPAVRS
jgi:hypothetical protein